MDLGVALVAYLLPLALRFDGLVPVRYWSNFWRFLPVAFAIHLAVNHACGLYGQVWRYASVQEARRIVRAGAIGGGAVILASMAIALLGIGLRTLPLSVVAFGAVLTMLGGGAIRFQSRLLAAPRHAHDDGWSRVLIIGAGSAGSMLLKDLLHNPSVHMRPVGLVDDDRRKVGRRLHGVPVLGTMATLPQLVERLGWTWCCWRSPRPPAGWCAAPPPSASRRT
jgi:FlaA1/EpsC-like NDP-sugar epimerase